MSTWLNLCPYQHSVKTYVDGVGTWQRGTDESLGVLILGNGQPQYRMRCRNCGRRSSALPRALVLRGWKLGAGDVEWVEQNKTASYDPCTYRDCTETPTEYHHFAPHNTFGGDAENWPCLPLCRTHHVDWHTRMDGYRWHRKGPSVLTLPRAEQEAWLLAQGWERIAHNSYQHTVETHRMGTFAGAISVELRREVVS